MKQNAICELCGTSSQARSQPEFFFSGVGREQGQIIKGQKCFVYSNENEGLLVLVLYLYTLIYEFIIGNKHEVLLGSKAKL